MTVKPQSRGDTKRQRLVDIGTALFTQKGFAGTGLDEIVQLADVPKGSFYYYFDSKEAYAQAVIHNYASYFAKKLDRTLGDTSIDPLQRLRAFAADASHGVQRFEFKRGCLVGNLAQEMASLQEDFRVLLLAVLDQWRDRVRDCIAEAQAAGQIASTADPAALAHFFWSAWEGAVLCAKLEQSTRALDNVTGLFIDGLLQPVGPARPGAARRLREPGRRASR
jgi:TetR/AcrR family transcriptional repressor of nem operon